jgi:hypothetical protein
MCYPTTLTLCANRQPCLHVLTYNLPPSASLQSFLHLLDYNPASTCYRSVLRPIKSAPASIWWRPGPHAVFCYPTLSHCFRESSPASMCKNIKLPPVGGPFEIRALSLISASPNAVTFYKPAPPSFCESSAASNCSESSPASNCELAPQTL